VTEQTASVQHYRSTQLIDGQLTVRNQTVVMDCITLHCTVTDNMYTLYHKKNKTQEILHFIIICDLIEYMYVDGFDIAGCRLVMY